MRTIGWAGLIGALLLVQGCREEEQDQILVHEKGVYQGQPDDGLADDRLQELRARANAQKF